MARSITSTMGASEIRYQLRAIMSFAFTHPDGLNKGLHLNITDEALANKPLESDPESDTSTLSSNANIYGEKKVESMLGYVDKNAVVHAIWPKI